MTTKDTLSAEDIRTYKTIRAELAKDWPSVVKWLDRLTQPLPPDIAEVEKRHEDAKIITSQNSLDMFREADADRATLLSYIRSTRGMSDEKLQQVIRVNLCEQVANENDQWPLPEKRAVIALIAERLARAILSAETK